MASDLSTPWQPIIDSTPKGQDMNKHAEAEPFFITEDVEADLRAAGYVFEPPKHVSTLRLSDVLTRLSNADLATWQGQIAERERAKRQGSRD